MGPPNERLIKARLAKGFHKASPAARAHGWTVTTYLSHENGQTSPIPRDAAFDYGRAFNVNPYYLLYESDDPTYGAMPPRPKAPRSVDERLAGQPEEVWEEVHQTIDTILKFRGKKSPKERRKQEEVRD